MDNTYAVVDEAATEIAEVYSSFGNLNALLLGQRSTSLFLSLFPPLYDETLTFYLFLIKEEANTVYTKSEDPASLFAERCQAVVQANSLWQTLQGKKRTTLPSGLSDPGYVVIQQVIERLQADARTHIHS